MQQVGDVSTLPPAVTGRRAYGTCHHGTMQVGKAGKKKSRPKRTGGTRMKALSQEAVAETMTTGVDMMAKIGWSGPVWER